MSHGDTKIHHSGLGIRNRLKTCIKNSTMARKKSGSDMYDGMIKVSVLKEHTRIKY